MAKAPKPVRDDGPRSARLSCPFDGSEMEKLTIEKIVLDRCTGCGAIWLDVPELSQVLSIEGAAESIDKAPSGQTPRRQKTGEAALLCPRDQTELRLKFDPVQRHISLLRCPTCLGILLRGGDLVDLSTFTLRERLASFFGH